MPKLLKQLQGKIDSETYDVLVKKKDVVISRSAFKDEDFVELRQIVGNVGN